MKFTDFHNSELAEASKTRNPTRDFLRNNPVSPDEMAKPVKQMSVPELATVSDEALDNAYHYGRSTPGNTFGWQANLKSAAYAKQLIDKGVTDIEQISDAIHKGWNVTARAFVQNPDQFDDTEKLKAAGKLEAKLQQRAKLMNIEYAQLPDDEQEKDRVVARALLQAIKGQQGVAEGRAPSVIQTIRDNISGAEISKDREGNLIFRRGFFYTNNGSAEQFAARIDNELTKLNIPHTIVDKGQVWRPFKGGATTKSQSHWWVKVKISQPGVADGFDKIQEVKKFRTTYGWAGGSKEPRSAHAKQVAAKRNEYNKGLGKFEPTDDMVGTAKVTKGVAEGSAQTYTVLAWKNSTNDSPDVEELDIEAGQARAMAQELKAEGYKVVKIKKQGVAEGWKDVVAGGAMALGALGAGAQTMPDINVQQVELANKYYNVLVQRAKEDGIKLDTRTLNVIKAKAIDAATKKTQQSTPQQDFPSQGSERKVAKDASQFESKGVAEGEKWIQKAHVKKGGLHKALHVPQDETIPKSRIAQAIHSADPHLRHMAQFAKNVAKHVAKEDAGGMGTGSVATSMGAGITRRRK